MQLRIIKRFKMSKSPAALSGVARHVGVDVMATSGIIFCVFLATAIFSVIAGILIYDWLQRRKEGSAPSTTPLIIASMLLIWPTVLLILCIGHFATGIYLWSTGR